MSTEDEGSQAPRATRPRRRLPMSPVNVALVAICIVSSIFCFITLQPIAGVALLIGGAFGGAAALFARRASAGDLERVNALEYTDERDRMAAMRGLAVVGVAALILSFVQALIAGLVREWGLGPTFALASLGILCIVWFAANWYFVRRG